MLGGGLNYLGSCSKGRSMLRQLHIAQSLFGESNDFGVFREEMGDGFEQGTTPIPRIAHILVFETNRVTQKLHWWECIGDSTKLEFPHLLITT